MKTLIAILLMLNTWALSPHLNDEIVTLGVVVLTVNIFVLIGISVSSAAKFLE